MADGFTRPTPPIHSEGAYLDLPLADYLADPALSGSAFKKLLSDPSALYWESDANPLWLQPERPTRRPQLRGSACHCAVLEGLDVYAQRYVVKPEGVLVTLDDLKDFIREERKMAEMRAGAKFSREEAKPYLLTGERDDLINRVLAINPKAKVWDAIADGREVIHADDHDYVRLLERFVRNDPVFAPLVTGGVPELSIFWRDQGLRFKARIDYLTASTVLDLKTYGQAPKRGRSMRQQCIMDATYNGYDLQAVHNFRAVEVARELIGANNLEWWATGANANARISAAADVLRSMSYDGPVFRWLFLRMGGAPTGISIPFRESDAQWSEARRQIDDAIGIYRNFSAAFAPGEPWLATEGEQEIEDTDWPLAAIRGAA